jgi:EEF1A N-terminal glycine/lysine methyltransferase
VFVRYNAFFITLPCKEFSKIEIRRIYPINRSMELFGRSDDESADVTVIKISHDIEVTLSIAEEESNESKKVLFATYIWTGSNVLAKYLVSIKDVIQGANVLEFGAAAGLPSIVAGKLGAKLVCASDFPSPPVITTLEKNIIANNVDSIVKVVPHIWSEDVSPILTLNKDEKYDIILAAECLWKHDSHPLLLQSILDTIKPNGILILTYSHHIPGLEAADDAFITSCSEQGFALEERIVSEGKHMWSDRIVDIYTCTLRYK